MDQLLAGSADLDAMFHWPPRGFAMTHVRPPCDGNGMGQRFTVDDTLVQEPVTEDLTTVPETLVGKLFHRWSRSRGLVPIALLVERVGDESADGDALEFALDDLWAWSADKRQSEVIWQAGGAIAVVRALRRDTVVRDELVVRTALRVLRRLCINARSAHQVTDAGFIKTDMPSLASRYGRREGFSTLLQTVEEQICSSARAFATTRLGDPTATTDVAECLHLMHVHQGFPRITAAAAEALTARLLAAPLGEGDPAPSRPDCQPLVEAIRHVGPSDVPTMRALGEATVALCVSTRIAEGRSLLGQAGMVGALVGFLDVSLARNGSADCLQIALYALSELLRRHTDNHMRFMREGPPQGPRVLSAVISRVQGGALARPVVVPLPLAEVADKFVERTAEVLLERQRQRDERTWMFDHYEAPKPEFGMQGVRDMLFGRGSDRVAPLEWAAGITDA